MHSIIVHIDAGQSTITGKITNFDRGLAHSFRRRLIECPMGAALGFLFSTGRKGSQIKWFGKKVAVFSEQGAHDYAHIGDPGFSGPAGESHRN